MTGTSKNLSPLYRRIYDFVRLVPFGRVATYGQIATLAGRCTPRVVGYAMSAVPAGSDVPWHRVINSQGRVSRRSGGDGHSVQRQLLEQEGVRFDSRGCVDFGQVGWNGHKHEA